MKKDGCCGELTEEFYIFSYTDIKTKQDRGTFFVGHDCAHKLIDMVNVIKKNASSEPLDIPPTFDISIDGGFAGGYKKPIKVLNYDVLTIMLLLASSWDVKAFYGAPANILERIVRSPLKLISRRDILKVNELIEKVDLFKTIKKHENEGAKIGHFTIPYFKTVLDFIQSEESDIIRK